MSLDQSLAIRQSELAQLGFQILAVEPTTLVAKRRTFYWDCIFTFVNYTVFVRRVTQLSGQMIEDERLQLLSRSNALNPSALPRGFQSGNAILVVYIADQVDIEAQRLCQSKARLEFAQFYLNGALDLSTESTYFIRHTPLWGGVYYSKFRYILSRLLAPKAGPNQEPLSTPGVIITLFMLVWFLLIALLLIVVVFAS